MSFFEDVKKKINKCIEELNTIFKEMENGEYIVFKNNTKKYFKLRDEIWFRDKSGDEYNLLKISNKDKIELFTYCLNNEVEFFISTGHSN